MAQIVRMNGLDPDLTMTESDFAIIKDLLNWVEDRRIDYKIYTIAPGYRMYYEAMYNKYFNDKIIDKALATGQKTQETWDDYIFHIINFTNPNRQLDSLKSLRAIWNAVDLKNISRLKDTHDALLVAIDIYKLIKNAVSTNSQQQPQQGNSDGQGGDGQDGSAESENGQGGDDNEISVSSAGFGNSDASDTDNNSGSGANVSELTPRELDKLRDAIEAQREFLKDLN